MSMTKQVDIIDIVELSPEEVIAKVNAATTQITRDDAVNADTVSGWSQVISEIRDAWASKPNKERGVIFSEPTSGQMVVIDVHKRADGQYEFTYDDDPVV